MDEFESLVREPIVANNQNETVPRTRLRKPTVAVHQRFSSSNCETCGYYGSVVTEVFLNGEKIYHAYGDDHLSPGPTHDDISYLGPLFEALGYNFQYTKESDYTDD